MPPKYFKKVVTKRGELLLGDTNSAPDPSNLPKERNVQPLLSETPASDRTDLGVEAPVAALKLERDEGSNTSS